jgi:hypothetical protein
MMETLSGVVKSVPGYVVGSLVGKFTQRRKTLLWWPSSGVQQEVGFLVGSSQCRDLGLG